MDGNQNDPPPAQWFVDPTDPSRWRWWDGRQWTEHFAPRDAVQESPQSAVPALLDKKQRSRFMRELIGSKDERAEAKAERLATRDEANAIFKAKIKETKNAGRTRSSHQGSTPSVAQLLTELTPEPLREPLDEQVEGGRRDIQHCWNKKVFRGRGIPIPTAGIEINDAECVLIPEPWNPHDPNAVVVAVDGIRSAIFLPSWLNGMLLHWLALRKMDISSLEWAVSGQRMMAREWSGPKSRF